MKRRLLSIFLSLTMILSMVPSVWAADETKQDDTDDTAAQETKTPAKPAMNGNCGATKEDTVTWKLEQNNTDDENPTYTLTISGSGNMANYTVPVPRSIGGTTVAPNVATPGPRGTPLWQVSRITRATLCPSQRLWCGTVSPAWATGPSPIRRSRRLHSPKV